MVNGEQSRSQRMIGLPFTVYCLPRALRSALSALRQGCSPETSPLSPASLLDRAFLIWKDGRGKN
jgi:hypothetical protein